MPCRVGGCLQTPIVGDNAYVYASNQPTINSDPSGLQDGGDDCGDCIVFESGDDGDDDLVGWGPDGAFGVWGSWGWGWFGGIWSQGPGGMNLKSLYSSEGSTSDRTTASLVRSMSAPMFSQSAQNSNAFPVIMATLVWWGMSTRADGSDALPPFAQAVLGRVIQNFEGSQAFQNCKAGVSASLGNNWFIKGFSLARVIPSHPPSSVADWLQVPAVRTSAEALAVKGGTLTLGYGGGYVLKQLGTDVAQGGEFADAGLQMINAGNFLQAGAKFGGKALGVVGTAATVGATGVDLVYPSYACRGDL